MVELAIGLDASRVEDRPRQYYGWALLNRDALMPNAEQVARAVRAVEELRRLHHGKIIIDAVLPDYYARFPKPCVGGWGRKLTQCDTVWQGAAVPRRGDYPGSRILAGARPFSCRDLGKLAGFPSISWHCLDAGTLPQLRAAGNRSWRLPVPGLYAHGKCRSRRSGLPSLAPPRGCRCACGAAA